MLKKGFHPNLAWNPEVMAYLFQAFGNRMSKISEALCCPPKSACLRINTVQTSMEDVLPKLQELVRSSVMSIGEERNECSSGREESCFEHPQLKGVVIVEGSGPHEVRYDDGRGVPLKSVVVSRRCAESVLRGAQVFVPGVLACEAHVDEGDMVAVSVAIERQELDGSWHVGITRGTTLGSSHSSLQEGTTNSCDRDRWHVGVGKALMSRAAMFRETKGIAVEMVDRVFRLPSFNGVLEGLIFLQNLPSIITVRVLDPQPGERVLDMCASPGGKTTAIAIQMQDRGEVIAFDRTHAKAMEVTKLAAEMGLSCIKAYKMDALKSVLPSPTPLPTPSLPQQPPTNFTDTAADAGRPSACHLSDATSSPLPAGSLQDADLNDGRTESPKIVEQVGGCDMGDQSQQGGAKREKAKHRRREKEVGARANQIIGFEPGSFDRVLVDAPCSALGLRPRLFAGNITLQELRNHGQYQRRIFDRAAALIKPGGVIVYSTCTLNPGENEALVRYALDTYPFLSLATQSPILGGPGLVGGNDIFDGVGFREWLRDGEQHLVQRFDPSGDVDVIGFFIAKFNVGDKPCVY